jgi:hypothetical protein
VDLEKRMALRDKLLGDELRQRELADLFAEPPDDPEAAEIVEAAHPLYERLQHLADEHLPLGSAAEAVELALRSASAFGISAVVEYCGGEERIGGDVVDEVRRLLGEQVAAGRLTVEYYWDCPSCGNVAGEREDLPDEPFTVTCRGGMCDGAKRTLDPARAHAVFVNAARGPMLESWI